jgi:tetratricopeptide (TPR) repeat protein
MGDILNDLGKPAEAEGEWRRALTLDPGHPVAHVRLGSLHLSRGDTERAAAAFEAALIYSPAHDEARAKLTEMRGAGPLPRESVAEGPDADRRRPGDRPGWLTDERAHDFVARLAASPHIDNAAVVDGEGAVQALSGERSAAGGMGPPGVSFTGEARSLLRRLGAGRLRSALIRGGALCLRIVPVGEWTLIVAAARGGPVGEVDAEIEGALADEPPDSADEGDYE